MTTEPIETTSVAVREAEQVVGRYDEMTVDELVARADKITEIQKRVMKEDVHYGRIPGTDGKKTLLKPGAETLMKAFKLRPLPVILRETIEGTFIQYVVRVDLFAQVDGTEIASGIGECNSGETKYMRAGGRTCPECGADAVIKGREEYGGGWLCFKKKDGCGAKWSDGTDQAEFFETHKPERQPNENVFDLVNTILKMAKKRALIDAVLSGTAASDSFTQDVGDTDDDPPTKTPPPRTEPRRDRYATQPPAQAKKPAKSVDPAEVKKATAQDLHLMGEVRGRAPYDAPHSFMVVAAKGRGGQVFEETVYYSPEASADLWDQAEAGTTIDMAARRQKDGTFLCTRINRVIPAPALATEDSEDDGA